MKKIIITGLFLLGIQMLANAQNAQIANMTNRLSLIAGNASAYGGMGFAFSKQIIPEKQNWLAKHYAAYCYIMQAQHTNNISESDSILLVANKYLISEKSIVENKEALLELVKDPKEEMLIQKSESMSLQALALAVKMKNVNASSQADYLKEIATLSNKIKKINPQSTSILFAEALSLINQFETTIANINLAKLKLNQILKANGNEELKSRKPNWGIAESEFLIGTIRN